MAGSLLSAEEWFSHGEKIGRVTMAASAVAIHMAGGKTLKYVVSVAGESVELFPGELTSATIECEPIVVPLGAGAGGGVAVKAGWETVVLEGPGVTKIIAASLVPYKKAAAEVVTGMLGDKVPLDALPWTHAHLHPHGKLVTHVWKDHLIDVVCVQTKAHGPAPTYAAQMNVDGKAVAEWPGAVDDAVKKTQVEAASKFAEQLASALAPASVPGHTHKPAWLDALAAAQESAAQFAASLLGVQGALEAQGAALHDLIKTNPVKWATEYVADWAVGTREWIEGVALDMGMAVVLAEVSDGYTVLVGAYVHDGSSAPQEWCHELRERLSEEGPVGVKYVVKPLTAKFAQETGGLKDLVASNLAQPTPLTHEEWNDWQKWAVLKTASFGPTSHFHFKGLTS